MPTWWNATRVTQGATCTCGRGVITSTTGTCTRQPAASVLVRLSDSLNGQAREQRFALPTYLRQQAAVTRQPMPRILYAVKRVTDRPPGAMELWPEAVDHLELNGGRLVHATQSFWRDGPGGLRLTGVRPAIAAARKRAGVYSLRRLTFEGDSARPMSREEAA